MRASQYYGDAAEADDLGGEGRRSLRQAGLRLSAGGGCLSLSCRREADLSLHKRAERQDAAQLLDRGVPPLSAQASVCEGTRAAHQTMGTRARARSRAAASRCQSASDAPASRDGRASLRHAEDADGRDAFSDEAPAEGRDRDGLARARLQSHARHEHHRNSTAPGGDEGIVALVCSNVVDATANDGLRPPKALLGEEKLQNNDARPKSQKWRPSGPLQRVFTRPRPKAVMDGALLLRCKARTLL